MMNTIKILGIEVINLINNTFCNDLVLNAGQHNYFEMFVVAFAIELKSSIVISIGDSISSFLLNFKSGFIQ